MSALNDDDSDDDNNECDVDRETSEIRLTTNSPNDRQIEPSTRYQRPSGSDTNTTDFNTQAVSCMLTLSDLTTKFDNPEKEKDLTLEEKRNLLQSAYKLLQPTKFSNEQLRTISDIVNEHIIHRVKFVENEFLRLKTKEEKEAVKKFPSFWQPDLVGSKNNIAKDVLARLPHLKDKSILAWAATWMGISKTVLDKIRYSRNSLHNYLKQSVMNGEEVRT